jgi:DNA-binding transcriptional LysR family regulator
VELVGLDPQAGLRRRLTDELRKMDRDPLFVPDTGVGGWYAAKEFARAGLGAAIVPLAILVPGDQRDLMLRHLALDAWMPEYVIHRPWSGEADGALVELIEVVKDVGVEFCQQTLKRWNGTA